MPAPTHLGEIDQEFLAQMQKLVDEASVSFSECRLRKASQTLMELSHAGNVYFDFKKPWKLAKEPATRAEMETVIALCIECIKNLALVASPIIPSAAQKIWAMLGNQTALAKGSWKTIHETKIAPGTPLADPVPLFRKIEDAEIEEQVAKLNLLISNR
jgi:methionyl-tRNA synthetase